MPDRLHLAQIRINGGTQPRASLHGETVREYAEAMLEGAIFPPVTVFYDGNGYWLADGFHRFEAAKLNGALDILAEIKQGTRRDAILYSVGANAAHGMRRTNADKRRAVDVLLRDEEWGKWSASEIGRRCNVSHDFAARLKNERSLSSDESEQRTYTTKHGTEAVMSVGNIGRRAEAAESPAATIPALPTPKPPPALVPQPTQRAEPSFETWLTRLCGRVEELRYLRSELEEKSAFEIALTESYREGHLILR